MRRATRAAIIGAFVTGAGPVTAIGGEEPQRRGVFVNPFADAPSGVNAPPLNPAGVTLERRRLGEGVYALLSDRPPTDNSGFIVGQHGVLVIDSHINPDMALQIIASVREVADKPILYLVNTNFHGDHTFGNATFPDSTTIIAHRATAERMADPEHESVERRLMLAAVGGDVSAIEGVRLRLPDLTFEDELTIDLGGRVVEVHHFGPGNTPGDTVVYEPSTGTAWTGNLIITGAVPPMFETGAAAYLSTISALASRLDVRTVIPGHGVAMPGAQQIRSNLAYLTDLLAGVRGQVALGHSLDETLEALPLSEAYLPPEGSPLAGLRATLAGFHRLNVQRTYEEVVAADVAGR